MTAMECGLRKSLILMKNLIKARKHHCLQMEVSSLICQHYKLNQFSSSALRNALAVRSKSSSV